MGEENAKWYILHTYSGYESMVEVNLRMVFQKNNLSDRLYEITIPVEEVLEEKNGKKKLVKRKMFPCYVFIKMDYNNDMWKIITETRGVTGFVGPRSRPLPLTEEEIKKMRLEKAVARTDYAPGDKVKIVSGALEGLVAEVESVSAQSSKCRVNVFMLGKMTPAELDLSDIEPIYED